MTYFASGIDFGTVINLIQNVIDYLNKWCSSADLSVDQKAGLMLITCRKKYKLRDIYLNGKVLSFQNSIRYLGFTIDHKLNWAEHCKIKARKAMTSLIQCKRAVGTKWGLSPKVLDWIYKAIILPGMDRLILLTAWTE